ncbi:ABC-type antimicrobial peptide transport system, ATPase component [Halobacteroides halobius DSM 5150]|uniref:ABC-type antimicrobial peptide transport system, ATPase component n=1 Tax=Halobacteroides halobius (strain ATCC 35273 / DSM 5150 / MD-1) TaxID=748449 RepID=L0K9W2_HALHC|nr:ABC transporter ATP-binding protein [Halobacteroides halobius]AGB40893.1 ABC-type antimicrobial peptide transport system, ATPase component [Halobacteroides halobius DSM 5150]
MTLLKLEGIKKIYQQGEVEVPALRGIDLTVEVGEFTSIAGPSGSGKSTLLNIVGCLDQPSTGQVYLEDTEIDQLSEDELAMVRRHNLGFIFQAFNLIPVLTVYENVEFALNLVGQMKKSEMKERVMDILDAVGLKDLADRKPNELSGGQKQRVSIARALVKHPKLVLADEPTANLDSKTSKEVLEVMLEMNKKLETTFIFSTHDPLIMDYAQRLIKLRDGQIVADKKTV